jgi:hypothetical protein
MMARHAFLPLLSAAAALLLACGGSSQVGPPPTVTPALAYTNPVSGRFRLVRNPASTDRHLVLDVTGPASVSGHGVALVLGLAGQGASWGKAGDAGLVHNLAFDLSSGTPVQVGLAVSTALQAAVFQKPGLATAVPFGQGLFQVAVDLAEDAPAGTVAVTLVKGQALAADGTLLDLSRSPDTLAIGTLRIK